MLFKLKIARDPATEKGVPIPISVLPTPSEVSVEAFLDQTIEEIPTVFGRLVYLAALRDPERGTYKHPILNQLLPNRNVERILRNAHGRIFHRWLEFNLRQQRGDLTRYLGCGALGHTLLRQLRDRDAFRTLPPADTLGHERALFATDLGVIINSALLD